jgi:hypothetical protein
MIYASISATLFQNNNYFLEKTHKDIRSILMCLNILLLAGNTIHESSINESIPVDKKGDGNKFHLPAMNI